MGTLAAYTFAWESFNQVCTDIIGTLKSYGVKLIIKCSYLNSSESSCWQEQKVIYPLPSSLPP